jgi:uncharacterized BrkB/YihY/UPF0761 family membrane protein
VKARAYWLTSIIVAAVALCVHATALHEAAKGLHIRARAVTAPEDQSELMKAKTKQFADRSEAVALVGLVLAVVSLVCLVASSRHHEPAWRSIPFALLVLYLLLQFAFV